MQFYTLFLCRILALEFGNFSNIGKIKCEIGVDFALSCHVLCISAHSNRIPIVQHFAQFHSIFDFHRIRAVLNGCIAVENGKADIKTLATAALFANKVKDFTNNGDIFLRLINSANGQRANFKRLAIHIFGRADIKNGCADAASPLSVFGKRNLAVNGCGTRKHCFFFRFIGNNHLGSAQCVAFIICLGTCGITAHFLNAILNRIVIIKGIIPLDGVKLDLQIHAIGIAHDLFHQTRCIGTFNQVDTCVGKRNIDIQNISRKIVFATVEKSLCNNTAAIGLHQKVGDLCNVKKFRIVNRTNADAVEVICYANLFLNTIKNCARNNLRKRCSYFDDALFFVCAQRNAVGVCQE